MPRSIPGLQRVIAKAGVRVLTIGSVQINTHRSYPEAELVNYMCHETGIGSGNVYRESELFADEAHAKAVAEQMDLVEQAKLDTKPEAQRAADYKHLTFRASLGRDWSDQLWNSWYLARELREAIETFLGTGEDARDERQLERAIEERSWPDPHPLDRLIAAARALLHGVSEHDAWKELDAALEGVRFKPLKLETP